MSLHDIIKAQSNLALGLASTVRTTTFNVQLRLINSNTAVILLYASSQTGVCYFYTSLSCAAARPHAATPIYIYRSQSRAQMYVCSTLTSTSTQCSDFTRTHQSHFTRIASSTAHTFESLPMSRKLAKPNVGYNLPSSTTAHPLKYLAECGGK